MGGADSLTGEEEEATLLKASEQWAVVAVREPDLSIDRQGATFQRERGDGHKFLRAHGHVQNVLGANDTFVVEVPYQDSAMLRGKRGTTPDRNFGGLVNDGTGLKITNVVGDEAVCASVAAPHGVPKSTAAY